MTKIVIFFTFILYQRAVVKQAYFWTHLLSYAKTVLWSSHCKIHRYVAVPLHLRCRIGWADSLTHTGFVLIPMQNRSLFRIDVACRSIVSVPKTIRGRIRLRRPNFRCLTNSKFIFRGFFGVFGAWIVQNLYFVDFLRFGPYSIST